MYKTFCSVSNFTVSSDSTFALFVVRDVRITEPLSVKETTEHSAYGSFETACEIF
jgi:hypothetical protein